MSGGEKKRRASAYSDFLLFLCESFFLFVKYIHEKDSNYRIVLFIKKRIIPKEEDSSKPVSHFVEEERGEPPLSIILLY